MYRFLCFKVFRFCVTAMVDVCCEDYSRATLNPLEELSPVVLQDDYRCHFLDDVLGLGGTSTVFRSMVGGTPVAVKVLANGQHASESLRTEEQALRQLSESHCTNVPHIAFVAAGGQPVLITQPVGVPLALTNNDVDAALEAYRSGSGGCNLKLLNAKFLGDVLQAMTQCHDAGVIHGDPRLSNIVIVESLGLSIAVLIDFGSAIIRSSAQ